MGGIIAAMALQKGQKAKIQHLGKATPLHRSGAAVPNNYRHDAFQSSLHVTRSTGDWWENLFCNATLFWLACKTNILAFYDAKAANLNISL